MDSVAGSSLSKDISEVEIRKKIEASFNGVDPSNAELYRKCVEAHKPGMSHEEMLKAYENWAETYDTEMCAGTYNGPQIAAEAMASFYPLEDRATVKILDVGAGTGRVGIELLKLGFKKFDALEPCRKMLELLLKRNIYGQIFESAVGMEPIKEIADDSYDSLVISGGMGEGHIPVNAVDEMIRMVKPGGTVFIVMREEYLSYVTEYVGRLEPYMKQLEDVGKWKQVFRNIVPEYSFKKNGVVFCYQVIINGN